MPILGDIPIIGKYLFTHKHTEKEQDVVIIFVSCFDMGNPGDLETNDGIPSEGKLIHAHMRAAQVQKAKDAAEAIKEDEEIEKILSEIPDRAPRSLMLPRAPEMGALFAGMTSGNRQNCRTLTNPEYFRLASARPTPSSSRPMIPFDFPYPIHPECIPPGDDTAGRYTISFAKDRANSTKSSAFATRSSTWNSARARP